ncbi:MAG: hypothetical protein UR69_C0001G0262 [Candidatus Moranbacteria bacterium GW2011_GWE2_35_2-]|nr:MAG: hypothetical protein UR69_C0001G0262 [Candidatus Moranbacteria bacterium GW2011_GWE2_35_2-]KKQ22740.1 MAG: hypothetical protein US37_C0001G0012 [Candidatus Moranbacteria bacterium GW2011_GWF2_37_11]KKQ28894.1 MAG: hypothetical protein US44_C0005G0036 [Candidatus Moranbacteria bacterium GW2011_GWD1_37_17]KKQ31029.1 MAG: hypothetical protein US47_C0001G0262 [Candidatus Moranbacteria bacterium GW2011_GWE1_37_24]KKQ48092.1 MAG: hypothetical protein US66_C0002G0036 [Candidatus Moranbacteria 
MKKILITGMFLSIFPLVAHGAFNISEWTYYKDVEFSDTENGLIKVGFDDEIFSQSNENFSDIRIMENANREVPFKLFSGNSGITDETYSVKMIDNSYVADQYSSVILDLGVDGKLTNGLILTTDSQNYQRSVIVYGSSDMKNWNVIKDNAYIYDYTDVKGNFKASNNTIQFSEEVSFRYLKVEIAGQGESPVRATSARAKHSVKQKMQELKRKVSFSVQDNSQRKSTEIIADLGVSGIPVNRLDLRAEGSNFNRGVIIYSGNNLDNLKKVAQDYIFNYETAKFSGENSELNFPEITDRYIKLEVLNKDNESLNFISITAYSVYREVIFQASGSEKYRIYYGNKEAEYPQYDIEKYFQYLDVENAKLIGLSAQKENQSFIPKEVPKKPISERIPYLLSSILILSSLALLFIVYRFLRK